MYRLAIGIIHRGEEYSRCFWGPETFLRWRHPLQSRGKHIALRPSRQLEGMHYHHIGTEDVLTDWDTLEQKDFCGFAQECFDLMRGLDEYENEKRSAGMCIVDLQSFDYISLMCLFPTTVVQFHP